MLVSFCIDCESIVKLFLLNHAHYMQDARHAQCKPPPNSDVARLKAVFKDYSCDGVHKAWTKVEKAELLKGLKQQIQESRIRTAMDNFK
jgi:hypothetical protein